MTTLKNTPGAKHHRRISAAERLEKLVLKYKLLAVSPELGELASSEIERKLGIAERELIVLKERIAKGGRKSTKKSGANTGRRMS